MTVRILQGDCREVMRTLPDASVDSIVTDPPYGLGFMGKAWDSSFVPGDSAMRRRPEMDAVNAGASRQGGRQRACADYQKRQAMDMREFQAWCEEWATEALRVVKPGGHLLAFSGTRTYHRMVCAIEDAGFEIRDQLQWIYASGFPKSMNLDNLRGDAICGCGDAKTQPDPGSAQRTPSAAACESAAQAERAVRSLFDADVSPPDDVGDERWQVLQPSVSEQSAPSSEWQQLSNSEVGCGEFGMERRRDAPPPQGELRSGAVRPSAGMGTFNGPQGRIRDGAPPCDGEVVRLHADAVGNGASRRSSTAAQLANESRTVAGQPEPQAGGAWPICGGCGKPILPKGLGTALKPANEPIVMARKPLIGTVAANVLAHGTGALNIDGCRIDGEAWKAHRATGLGSVKFFTEGETPVIDKAPHDLGRWPANVILSVPEDEYELREGVTPAQRKALFGWLHENA